VSAYPLICGFRQVVIGKGFVASVGASGGRVLARHESESSWWLCGVNPGAIAESGTTLLEAHARLMQTFAAYLVDVAEDAKDFSEFKAEVERFFKATNVPTEEEWKAAVEKVRAGTLTLKLAKQPADSPLRLEVIQIVQPRPSQNQIVEESQMNVAA